MKLDFREFSLEVSAIQLPRKVRDAGGISVAFVLAPLVREGLDWSKLLCGRRWTVIKQPAVTFRLLERGEITDSLGEAGELTTWHARKTAFIFNYLRIHIGRQSYMYTVCAQEHILYLYPTNRESQLPFSAALLIIFCYLINVGKYQALMNYYQRPVSFFITINLTAIID